jgi:alanine racemase
MHRISSPEPRVLSPSLQRRAWIEVDLAALVRNAEAVAARAQVPLLPMVKADAYGLGAVPVARALQAIDPWGFGVATVAEGEELRRAGITRPVIVFTPLLPEDLDAVQRSRLTPALGSLAAIERWTPTRRPWHLAVDTGMNRAGVQWDAVRPLRDALLLHPPEGVFTHLHSADLDNVSRDEQEARFEQVLADLPFRPRHRHVENGPAVEHRAPSRWTLARPGIFLYGVGSGHGAAIEPEPVVSVRARVVDVRDVAAGESVSYGATWKADGGGTARRVATLAIGYADGYRRSLGNRGVVLIRGERAPVVGWVTMDMTMVDVTGTLCEPGDVATLIGSDGEAQITVAEVAALCELSPYEILTGLRGRMPRTYVERTA